MREREREREVRYGESDIVIITDCVNNDILSLPSSICLVIFNLFSRL